MPQDGEGYNGVDRTELAREIIEKAMNAGASAADVLVREGTDFSTSVRLRAVEKLHQARFHKVGVRIFAGMRSAVSATSDLSPKTISALIRDTLGMAQAAGQDRNAGLPPSDVYRNQPPKLALTFPAGEEMGVDDKIRLARECEEASLVYDSRINNSEGACFSDSLTHVSYGNSLGVFASYSKSVWSLMTTPLAEQDGLKQRDFWLSTHPDVGKLQPPAEVGIMAARRTLRRLGARKVATCEVPVVLEPLAAASVLKHLSEAVSGTALMRKASFLTDKLGSRVASSVVTVHDDGLLPGGLGSRPFDSEGVASRRTTVIRDGVLESYLLDAYSARKLGLQSTGNSDREPHGSASVGPSNFFLEPGRHPPEEIIGTVKRGLLVSQLIGFGVNIVSGDYSQGAAGLWIEDGVPAFPVEEITVSGNLKDMLTRIEAVGNDLLVLGEVFSPTVLIGKMVISGS